MSSNKNIVPKNDNKNADFISHLPMPIIHHILSLLSDNKERARACVLSKTWMNHYASRPVMVFHESDFRTGNRFLVNNETRTLFMNYVDQSLDRCIQMKSDSLERFELCLTSETHDYVDHPPSDRVNQWLRKSSDIGVKTMHLKLGPGDKLFDLALHSHTLVELHLNCFGFIIACKTINLLKLKSLSLFGVDLRKGSLKMLVEGCPMIEILIIAKCVLAHNVQVSGLARLVVLKVCYCVDVEEIEIGSPFFQTLSLLGPSENTVSLLGAEETVMRKLVLHTWISTKISPFRFLEELKLMSLCIKDRISSQSLKKLLIKLCSVETALVEIDCPNLLFLDYYYNQKPFYFVRGCNPIDFRYEFPLEIGTGRSEQISALGNVFGNTYKAVENLKMIIFNSDHVALKEIIILEGLFELMLYILNVKESLDPIIITHSIDWFDICFHQDLNNVAINVVSLFGSKFPKDVWEELFSLQKSRNVTHGNLCSVEMDYEEKNVPTILQEHQGSEYQVTRILLNFDWPIYQEIHPLNSEESD